MPSFRDTIAILLLLTVATTAKGQIGRPSIVGQVPITIDQGTSVTIQFNHLIVFDINDFYPNGFTLTVYEGKHYTFENTTVTPDASYHGNLTVPVSVNDGTYESKKYDLKITVREVKNIQPVITDQEPLTVVAGESINLDLLDFIVTDPDNVYPDDFTLKVFGGKDYDVSGTTVTPHDGFSGELQVEVTVHDGTDESEKYKAVVTVTPAPNVPPVITGQRDMATDEDKSLTIDPNKILVTDPDNIYPEDFTLTVYSGDNYTFEGTTVIPALNFFGALKVKVSVNDGEDESNIYTLTIDVRPINDPPVITSQLPLSTYVDTPIDIKMTDLVVSDPDNTYPTGFTMKLYNGLNYKVSGNTITPNKNFIGILFVPVTVDDGQASSEKYTLEIRVLTAPNVPPQIVDQQPNISITQGAQLEVLFTHLVVVDPDNSYPKDFTLRVLTGTNYTVSGTIVTPNPGFVGTLSVRVRVNDGTDNSNIFNLQVSVVPTTVTPQIIGQHAITINEDESYTVKLGDLLVSDADDTYPIGFTLQVFESEGYTLNGYTVTPAKDLNGFVTVPVTVKDDDGNQSEPFNLVIIVSPVNDAPTIALLETSAISYEPGGDPVNISSTLQVKDVDSDHISLAEITFTGEAYEKGYDKLVFVNTEKISGFFDENAGKLSLIGFATLEEYTEALRSVQYEYALNLDEGGSGGAPLPGNRTLSIIVNDGQIPSTPKTRTIIMETGVDLDIPTVFTPNGDGANETWNVYAISNAHQCENAVIKVYNKRGLLIFHTVGLEKQWDGTYENEVLPTDTYYYTIDLNLNYAKRTYRGAVALLR